MIVPNPLNKNYNEIREFVARISDYVKDVIMKYCQDNDFLFDDRLKTLESVAEKIETGRYKSWIDIDDIYACTIVINLATEEEDTIKFLNSIFDCIMIKRKTEIKKAPDVFRFDSTRFIGRLKKPVYFPDDRYINIYDIKFEIQIKTIFDYAWSKTNHALTYKSDEINWQKLRLSAQLKASVEQLDMLLLGFEKTAEYVGRGRWPDIEDKIIILNFFKEKFDQQLIPRELTPKNWSRFCDNIYRLFQAYQRDRPTGRSDRRLNCLETCLDLIDNEIKLLDYNRFPRSISLFQFVLGTLGTKSEFEKFDDYYTLVTDELRTLYPNLCVPGKEFNLDLEKVS